MSEAAKVTSLEAIKEFKVALAKFEEQARQALITAQADIQRAIDRVQNEYLAYWRHEQKRWERKFSEAKSELARIEMQPRDQRPSAVVERKNVEKAQMHIRRAQEKIERVKRWGRELEKEANLCRSQLQQLDQLIESDVPKAKALVERMLSELEQYVSLASPDTGIAGAGAAHAESSSHGMARSSSGTGDADAESRSEHEPTVQVPTNEERANAPVLDAWPDVSQQVQLDAAERKRVERLVAGREPLDPTQRIVVDPAAIDHSSLALDRMLTPPPGDSGWFLGAWPDEKAGDSDASRSYRSTTVGELLDRRADLEPVLRLPPGTQVWIDQGCVASVYDTRDEASADESNDA